MDVCLRVLKESNKDVLTATRALSGTVYCISYITFRDCREHILPTTFLEIAVYEDIL